MRLETASHKAIKFSCLNYHYAKTVPVNVFGYSVFNDQKEFCGVIVFGSGSNRFIASQFGKVQGEVLELVRVALNGKQENVSKPLSIALRLLKKDKPLCQKVISYADKEQGHKGIIYKASNWVLLRETKSESRVIINNKIIHPRSIYGKIPQTLEAFKTLDPNASWYKTKGKYLYVFDL